MEEAEWKRDETPYLVFACYKCHQFSYVKTTQKTKKCLRCGHSHQVESLLRKAEIVNGMTSAVNRVKFLQNELGYEELKEEPDFASEGGFKIASNNEGKERNVSIMPQKKGDEDEQLFDSFILMLRKLSEMYRTFPKYIIEIIAENKNIPQSEITRLIRRSLKEGYLKSHDGNYALKRLD
ncbi:MAG: DUF1922 domain-containing protein [Promethearchaeota archaeon]